MMNYKPEELKRLQEVELDILIEIIRVCNENKITYFTVGGTTLGAIRHNGFIPWDDDIDIGMMRDDYERFLRIAPEKLREGYTLQSFYTEPSMPTYFAKVRKDGTLFVEEYAKDIDMHQGIYVDIMPYDKIPEDDRKRKKYRARIKLWNQLYIAKTIKTTSVPHAKNKTIKNTFRRLIHYIVSPISKKQWYEKLDQEMRKYNNTDSGLVSSRGLSIFECKIKDILPPVQHSFSGITVMIPNNYDKVLRVQYGDYMKLPPENKRYSHAPVKLKV